VRILVVDDEPRHLRGMLNLLRQLRPSAEIIAAKDGASALELVRSELPEVVLSDIRMPNMDGLTFLQKLKEENIDTKVVMVSAYDLFEYAQKAVRHGAYDYLLKPVEVEKIEEVLSRIELQLAKESMQHEKAAELKHQMDSASSAYRNRLLLAWLNGSITMLEYDELSKYDELQGEGLVIFSKLTIHLSGDETYDFTLFLRDLEHSWANIGEAMTIPLNALKEDGFQAVTIIRSSPLTLNGKKEIRSVAAALARNWMNVGQLSHGIGPSCTFLLLEAPKAYRASQTANRYNFYESWKGVLFHDELLPSSNAINLDLEKLFEALIGNAANDAIDMCRAAFKQLADGGHANPAVLKENVSLLLMKLISRIRPIVDRKVGSLLANTATTLIQDCGTYNELMVFLEDRLLELHDALMEAQQNKNEIIVANCLGWIQENAKEDVTLERAAEHFFFNPSYFSTLIKSRTGRTFSEHVTAARMKRAKELLAENRLRIYEISVECGYQDTKYFCRVFKKHNGVSPESYKHTLLPERKHEE
jgi:two-component system response regulator YesN